LRVVFDRIDAQSDDLRIAFVELRLHLRHVAQLGRAHGREVFRVREEDRPRVADPLMKANAPLRSLGFEIRSDIANLESHCTTSCANYVTVNARGRASCGKTSLDPVDGTESRGNPQRTPLWGFVSTERRSTRISGTEQPLIIQPDTAGYYIL